MDLRPYDPSQDGIALRPFDPKVDEPSGVDALVDTHATRTGVPPPLLRALLKQESGFNPAVVNGETGATGLGQLMPATAESLGVTDRTDPEQSVRAAADYLRQGYDREGTVRGALHYYYGGPNKDKWGTKTRAYPDQVLRHIDLKDRAAMAWNDPQTMTLRPYDPSTDEAPPPQAEPAPLALRPFDPKVDAVAPTPEVGDEFTAMRAAAAEAPPQPKLTGSVIDSIPAAPRQGPPIRPEVRARLEDELARNAADHHAMLAREDWVGQAARLNDPAVQARVEMLTKEAISKGATPEAARAWAINNATAPDAQTIGPTTYDFDTREKYKDASPVTRGVVKGIKSLSQSAGGILEATGDLLGADPKGIRETNEQLHREMDAIGEGAHPFNRQLESAISSTITQLPGFGMGLVKASAAIPLMFIGAQSFGQEYSDGKRAGLSSGDAAFRGSVFMTAEVTGELMGMPSLVKWAKATFRGEPSSKWMRMLAEHIAKEQGGEQFTTALEDAFDKFAPQGLKPGMTFEDYLGDVRDTIVQTAMQAVMLGGTGAAVSNLSQRIQNLPSVRADRAKDEALAKWQGFATSLAGSARANKVAPASSPAENLATSPSNEGVATGGDAAAATEAPGMTEERMNRILASIEAQGQQDVAAQRQYGPAEQHPDIARAAKEAANSMDVVAEASSRQAAVKQAAALSIESGEKHAARMIGDQWVVVRTEPVKQETPDARAVESQPAPGAGGETGAVKAPVVERVEPAAPAAAQEAPRAEALAPQGEAQNAAQVEEFENRRTGEVKRFDTEAAAITYQQHKANRVPGNYRPTEGPDGWTLTRPRRERTPGQRANDQRMKLDRTNVRPHDEVKTIVGKLGGWNVEDAMKDGVKKEDIASHRYSGGFGNPLFRKTGGRSIDGIAEALDGEGFDVRDEYGHIDATKAREIMHEALNGNNVYSPEGQTYWADRGAEERARHEAAQLRAVDHTASGLERLGDEDQRAVADALASLESISTHETSTISAESELTEDAFWRIVNDYLEGKHENLSTARPASENRQAVARSAEGGEALGASENPPRAASGDEGVRFARAPTVQRTFYVQFGAQRHEVTDAADASDKWDAFRDAAVKRGAGARDIGNGVEVKDQDGKVVAKIAYNGRVFAPDGRAVNTRKEALALTQQTPADAGVAASRPALDLTGETEAQIKQREALEKKVADEKRAKDSAPPAADFTLTGSDRPADVAEAHGQTPLFARLTPHKSKATGFPVFTNDEVNLANAREARTQPIERDLKRYAFDILDAQVFKDSYKALGVERAMARAKVGEVLLDLRGNEVATLHNIEFYPTARGQGYGRMTVRSMLESQDEPILIRDIQPEAVDFWLKMGAKFPRSADYMEARLDRFQYATKNRSASFGRDASEGARGLRASTEGRGEDTSVRPEGRRDSGGDRDQARVSGLSTSEVRALVEPIVARWTNPPNVHVIASMDAAPKAVRQADERQLAQGAEGRPFAFFHGGEVYLVAAEIKTARQAVEGLYHEGLGHYGLRGVYGTALAEILNQLAVARREEVSAKAKAYGLDPLKREDRLVAAEEVLAEMAQTRPELGFVRRAVAAIRNWLRDHGIDLKWSDADIIQKFILPARNWVERGKGTVEPDAKAAFARAVPDANEYGEREAKLRSSGRSLSEHLADLFHSDKTFGWWHRSIGTQYHKAQVDADFAKVYNRGQDYLHEMSRAALEAADQAPHLLPKIEGFRGAVKSIVGAASQKDIKAIAKPLLDGTLQSDNGNPHEGKVWSDAQLRDTYKLTDAQLRLYREARKSIDVSLDQLLASEVAALAKKDVDAETLDAIRQDPAHAGDIAGDALASHAEALQHEISDMLAKTQGKGEAIIAKQAESSRLLDLATTLSEKQQNVESLKAHGYAPLMRFGQYSVSAYETTKNGADKLVYFSLHESQREANAVRREAQKQFPDARVVSGIKPEQSFQLYQGLTPDTLELFAHTLGVGQDSVFQQYLQVAKNTRSAFKRMIHREGVQGFEVDPARTLAAFITSNARAVAGNWHMGELKEAAINIPASKGDVKDDATRLVLYLQNPQEEAPMLRNYLFIQYLGGSIASAMVNMTQPLTMTYPYLAQYGAKRAAGELTLGMAQALMSDKVLAPELQKALHRGEQEGVVAPHEIHQLHAEAMRHLGSNIWIRRTLTAWGSLFAAAEAFNRRSTFIAAWRMGSEDKVADTYAFAANAVEATQGVYNRGNRPNWSRGAVGATIMTFKQFSISYLEFLKRLPPREQAIALAILFMLAGVSGLPFAEDAEDLIDTIAQALGYSFNTKQELRHFLAKTLGKEGAAFVMNGASHLPGVPLDVQGRLGMGNLIPGSSVGKRSLTPEQRLKEALQVLGPIGGLIGDVAGGAQALSTMDWKEISKALPIAGSAAIQNVIKAVDMWQTGMYRDGKGRKVKDTTPTEAVMKGVGFQPQSVAADSKKMAEQMQNIQLHRQVESKIAQDMAEGRFERGIATNDAQRLAAQKKIEAARQDLQGWNEKNPDAPIAIRDAQIQRRVKEMRLSREERTIKHAPREIRRSVREEMTE